VIQNADGLRDARGVKRDRVTDPSQEQSAKGAGPGEPLDPQLEAEARAIVDRAWRKLQERALRATQELESLLNTVKFRVEHAVSRDDKHAIGVRRWAVEQALRLYPGTAVGGTRIGPDPDHIVVAAEKFAAFAFGGMQQAQPEARPLVDMATAAGLPPDQRVGGMIVLTEEQLKALPLWQDDPPWLIPYAGRIWLHWRELDAAFGVTGRPARTQLWNADGTLAGWADIPEGVLEQIAVKEKIAAIGDDLAAERSPE
jgi:hypothetical protein